VPLLSQPWKAHDVDDVEKLLQRAISASPIVYLDEDRRDDLLCFLFEMAVKAARDFDPHYGDGGQSFATFLYRRAKLRVVDWLRRNYGDERHNRGRVRPVYVPLDELDQHTTDGGIGNAISTADFSRLSAQGQATFTAYALPIFTGQVTTLTGAAVRTGTSRPRVLKQLLELKAELDESG
jgi:DNA-directed RNA polymerase specialized sigma24 family protein